MKPQNRKKYTISIFLWTSEPCLVYIANMICLLFWPRYLIIVGYELARTALCWKGLWWESLSKFWRACGWCFRSLGDQHHVQTSQDRIGFMNNQLTPGTVAGLIWIRDHLKQTTPPGCGLPVDAMLHIEDAIKKGIHHHDCDSNKEGRLRRI